MNRREFAKHAAMGVMGSMVLGCLDAKTFPFKKNQVIACIGDSVTFANENGYVEILQKIADEKRPKLNLTFLNWGLNSETTTGLTEKGHPGARPYLIDRIETLLAKAPIDIAFFCYGINCGIYGKPYEKLFALYKKGMQAYLSAVHSKDIKAVVLTPPPLADPILPFEIRPKEDYSWKNPYPEYDSTVVQKFRDIVLTTDHEAVLAKIDIHTILKKEQLSCYGKDPIHPNSTGHLLIADTIADHLGF